MYPETITKYLAEFEALEKGFDPKDSDHCLYNLMRMAQITYHLIGHIPYQKWDELSRIQYGDMWLIKQRLRDQDNAANAAEKAVNNER